MGVGQLPVRPRLSLAEQAQQRIDEFDRLMQRGPKQRTLADIATDKIMEAELSPDDLSVVRGSALSQTRTPLPVRSVMPPIPPPNTLGQPPNILDLEVEIDAARMEGRKPVIPGAYAAPGTVQEDSGVVGEMVSATGDIAKQAARSGAAGVLGFDEGFYDAIRITGDVLGLPSLSEFGKQHAESIARHRANVRGPMTGMGPMEQAAYGGVESIGQNVPAIAAGIVAGPAAALGLMGATVGSQEYAKARDSGVSTPESLVYAVSQGAIEVATEKIPASRLLMDLANRSGILKTVTRQLVPEIGGEQVATILQDLNDWAVLNPEAPFASYLAERPSAAAQTLVSTVVATIGQGAGAAALNKLSGAGASADDAGATPAPNPVVIPGTVAPVDSQGEIDDQDDGQGGLPPIIHGPDGMPPQPPVQPDGPVLPPPPVAPPAPPPSINPNLPDELIQQLRDAGVRDDIIRSASDPETGQLILDSTRQAQEKPKPPVRPRVPQGPPDVSVVGGQTVQPKNAWRGYLDADQQAQDEAEIERLLQEPSIEEQTDGGDNPDLRGPAERLRQDAQGGEVRDDDSPERDDPSEGGVDGGRVVGPGEGARGLTPSPDESDEQWRERLYGHIRDDAKAQDPGVDEADIRRRYDDAVRNVDNYRSEVDDALTESSRNPHTLLGAIEKAGGLYDDEVVQPMSKGGKITTTRRMTGELRWLMEGSRFGRVPKEPGKSTSKPGDYYQLVRKRRTGGSAHRSQGLTWDGMVEALRQDKTFSDIETVNDLIEAVTDALNLVRQGKAGGKAWGPITLSDLEGVANIRLGEPWWVDRAPEQQAPEQQPAPDNIETRLDAGLDDILSGLDGLLDEPGSLGMATKEEQPPLPEAGKVREQNIVTPKLDAPFSLDREADQRTGRQDSLFGEPQKPAKKKAPVRSKDEGTGSLFMPITPDPKVVVAVMQTFRRLAAEKGIVDFDKAVNIIADGRGVAFVEGLKPHLAGAWNIARKGNPKMGPAGDVDAILAARPKDAPARPDSPAPAAPGPADASGGDGTAAGPTSGPADTGTPGRLDGDGVAGPGEPGPVVVDGQPGAVPGAAQRPPQRQTVEQQRDAARVSPHVAPYARRSKLRGAQHPKLVVESRAISGVAYPDLTEKFSSPEVLDAIENGRVSVEQAEQALAAVQANAGERETVKRTVGSYTDMEGNEMPKGLRWAYRSGPGGIGYSFRVERQEAYSPTGQPVEVLVQHDFPSGSAGLEQGMRWGVAKAWELAKAEPESHDIVTKPGHGYLIADGVGVGKSRELALTALELMHRAKQEGRELRLLFATYKGQNIDDFLGELAYVSSGRDLRGRDLASQDELADPVGKPGTVPFEVIRITEHKQSTNKAERGAKDGKVVEPPKPLPHAKHGIYVIDHEFNYRRYSEVIEETGLHGMLADEAHELKNIYGSGKGEAWQALHAKIYTDVPRAEQVFVYSTATPAQDLQNLEYLYGLRMWPLDGFQDFIETITGRASTQVSNRILNYIMQRGGPNDGTLPDKKPSLGRFRLTQAEAEQVPREMKALGRMSARDLWRAGTVYKVHEMAMPKAEEDRYNEFVAVARGILSVADQASSKGGKVNHMNLQGQITFAGKRMQLEGKLKAGIERAKFYIESGHQVVLSTININETDMGTHGNLHGAIGMIPEVRYVNGAPVEIPGIAALKEALYRRAAAIGKLEGPVQAVRTAFGEKNVAVLIGGMDATDKSKVKQFQAGERSVIVISAAGSTGVNLQQRFLTGKGTAQGRRVFIPIQNEWSAIRELQRYGRVDRADSVMPPIIEPISFGNALEKRFFGSIAARMKSMGALSTGGETNAGDALDEFDFEDAVSAQAIHDAWEMSPPDLRALFLGAKFQNGIMAANTTIVDVQRALMLMPIRRANQYWKLFADARQAILDRQSNAQDPDAKTKRHKGKVLRKTMLNEHLALYQLVDENGHKFGMLSGVVMPYMTRLAPALATGDGNVRRSYGAFEVVVDTGPRAGASVRGQRKNEQGDLVPYGDIVAGLEINQSRIENVARIFGKDLSQWDYFSIDDVLNHLESSGQLAVQVPLAASNENGTPLSIHKRLDGTYQVSHATLKMLKELKAFGVEFDGAKNLYTVQAKNIRKFLAEFYPLKANLDTFESNYGEEQFLASPAGLPVVNKRKDRQRARMTQPHLQIPKPKGIPVTTKAKDQMGPRQLREYFEKKLGLPIRVGGFNKAKAWGLYYLAPRGGRKRTHPEMVRLAEAEDLTVMAHEVGHHIAIRLLGLDLKDQRWRRELIATGHATIMPSYDLWQKVNEGAAEFFRMWLTDRVSAFNSAPNFAAAFTDALAEKPELQEILVEAQRQVHNFIELDDVARLDSRISVEEAATYGEESTRWQRLMQGLDNDQYAIGEAVRAMAPTAPVQATQDAAALAQLSRGDVGQADKWLRWGLDDRSGKHVRGMVEILDAFSNKQKHNLRLYAVARRAVELHAREDVVEYAVEQRWAEATIQRFKSPEFDAALKEIYAFQSAVLHHLVKHNVISQKAADAMEELNQNYVPWQRMVDRMHAGMGGTDAFADVTSPIRRIRGSGYDIIDPFESIWKNTYIAANRAAHNDAMHALWQQARRAEGSAKILWELPPAKRPIIFNLQSVEADIRIALAKDGVRLPDNVDLNAMATLWVPQSLPKHQDGVVTVLDKGKVVFLETKRRDLFDALLAYGPKAIEGWLKWTWKKPASALRKAVTASFSFIVRNSLRDPWVATIQSRYGFIPVVDNIIGFYEQLGNKEMLKAALESKMGQATIAGLDRTQIQRRMRRMTGELAHGFERVWDAATWPYDMVAAFSEMVELAPRVAEFRLAVRAEGQEQGIIKRLTRKQKGSLKTATADTKVKAALAGRNLTLDFQRGGSVVRNMNQGVPFLNAQVQGISQMARTFRERPGHAFAVSAMMPLMSMVAWMLRALAAEDDEEFKEAWGKITDEERNYYWHFPARWTESGFIRMPKPFEYAGIFANTLESFWQHAYEQDPDAVKRAMQGIIGIRSGGDFEQGLLGFFASFAGPLFLTTYELMANHDTYRNQPISPELDYVGGNLPPEYRHLDYGRWTSQVSRNLGALMQVSPRKLDHIFYSLGGNTARGHIRALDDVGARLGLSPRMPSRGPSGWPGVGGIYTDPKESASTRNINKLYEDSNRLAQLQQVVFPGLNPGRALTDLSKVQAAMADNAELLARSPRIHGAVMALRGERLNIDRVLVSQASPNEKREEMRAIHDRMDTYARFALGEPVTLPQRQGALPVAPRIAR